MATKKELEAEVDRLNEKLREVKQASKEIDFIDVQFPRAPFAAHYGNSPHTSPGFGERMHPVILSVLEQYGCDVRSVHSKGQMRLQSDSFSGPKYIAVQRPIAEVLARIMDVCGEFAWDAYRAGVENGSNLLMRLQKGEITVDSFEESLEREKALNRQSRFPTFANSIRDFESPKF